MSKYAEIVWSARRNDGEVIHSEQIPDGSTWYSVPLIVEIYDSGNERKRSHEIRTGVYVEENGTLTWEDIQWRFADDVARLLEADTGITPIPAELMDWIDIENTPAFASMTRAVVAAIGLY